MVISGISKSCLILLDDTALFDDMTSKQGLLNDWTSITAALMPNEVCMRTHDVYDEAYMGSTFTFVFVLFCQEYATTQRNAQMSFLAAFDRFFFGSMDIFLRVVKWIQNENGVDVCEGVARYGGRGGKERRGSVRWAVVVL